MTTVAGIFDSDMTASRAVSSLLDEGFTTDDISLIMSRNTREDYFPATGKEDDRAAKGGIVGAVTGGALGALIAGLAAVGTIAFPAGGLLATGPVVAALAGAGAGGAVGGLSGALISLGFAADEARRYEEEVKQGRAVVIVHAEDDDEEAAARNALAVSGAAVRAA